METDEHDEASRATATADERTRELLRTVPRADGELRCYLLRGAPGRRPVLSIEEWDRDGHGRWKVYVRMSELAPIGQLCLDLLDEARRCRGRSPAAAAKHAARK